MNRFYVWCEDTTNIYDATTFDNDSERASGFIAGTPAKSVVINTALRQANLVACALMDLFAPDNSSISVESSRNDIKSVVDTALTAKIKATKVDNASQADEATLALNADNATNDSDGSLIKTTYVKNSKFSDNTVTSFNNYIVSKKKLIWSGDKTAGTLTEPKFTLSDFSNISSFANRKYEFVFSFTPNNRSNSLAKTPVKAIITNVTDSDYQRVICMCPISTSLYYMYLHIYDTKIYFIMSNSGMSTDAHITAIYEIIE